MTRKYLLLLLAGLLFCKNAVCCTVFSCAMHGEVFSAGNEDDDFPFARIWFSPPSRGRYGSVSLGFNDLAAQAAMNEHGLFYDFTAQYNIKPAAKQPAVQFAGDFFFEILGKCKTVPEVIVYLKKYGYPGVTSQATFTDAEGRSVVVNADTMIEKQEAYQINTNFNIADASTGHYYDHRYDDAKRMLSGAKNASVEFLKQVLNRTHQEGGLNTQYSYIFDQKRKLIYLYLFHNYDDVYIIDMAKELKKGYRLNFVSDYFPLSFAYETYTKANPLYRKEMIVADIADKGLKPVTDGCLAQLSNGNKNDSDLAPAMLEVALQLVKNSWNQHTNGAMWEYWFGLPGGYNVQHFRDERLTVAYNIFEILARREKDTKLINFMREISAYISLVQGNNKVAEEDYKKVIAVPSESYDISVTRSKEMLKVINQQAEQGKHRG